MHTTSDERRNHAWFALADAEHCRLLCSRWTGQGTHHVDEYGKVDNTLPEAEHERPMSQGGMTHDIEEEERRFVAQIVEWLRKQAEEHKISRLTIFAPPRILGVLRQATTNVLKGHLEELRGDLMRLDAGQLAQHPLVRDLLVTRHKRSPTGRTAATPRRASRSRVG